MMYQAEKEHYTTQFDPHEVEDILSMGVHLVWDAHQKVWAWLRQCVEHSTLDNGMKMIKFKL